MSHFYKLTLVLLSFFAFSNHATAQIGVGTTTPNSSAALDVTSTSKGLLIPRMTTLQRNADIKAWYNKGDDKAYINIATPVSDQVLLSVTDMQGKTIVQQQLSLQMGLNQVRLPMAGLADGIYNFTVSGKADAQTKRVMKY